MKADRILCDKEPSEESNWFKSIILRLYDGVDKETKGQQTYQMHTWLQNCLNFHEFPSSNNTKLGYITSEPEED